MSKLIIGFSNPRQTNPVSWLIRKINKTPYSHTYIKIYSASLDRFLIYQARGTQVNFVGNKRFESYAQVCKEYELDVWDKNKTKILQFCVDNAGEGYGVKQLFGMLYVAFFKAFGVKKANPFTAGMVCTEVIVLLLQLLAIPIDTDPDTADLNDVSKALDDFVRFTK